MNTLDTLYFPDTALPPHRQFPLALFFDAIHLLQPVENVEPSSATDCHPFMETGICQVHTPSRLGADRERFLHLLHDIQNRKDNYVEQLNYLSLASLSTPGQRGEDSKQTIVASLVREMGQGDDHHGEEERLVLWQSRLVLKIAEILDQEEEELARQMAAIDEREIALFRSLQGEIAESGEENGATEDPFQELVELRQKMNRPRPGMVKNRLRAWNRLYWSGTLPKELPLWTTGRREAADILLEEHENQSGQPPVTILRIDLPARLRDHSEPIEAVRRFRAMAQTSRQELTATLNDLLAGDIFESHLATIAHRLESWQTSWNARLESWFPASRHGRAILTVYLLTGTPCARLLTKPDRPDTPQSRRHGLLAVYEEPDSVL